VQIRRLVQSRDARALNSAELTDTLLAWDALRVGRLTAYLREREPDDSVGYSILMYKLSAKELAEALRGPARFSWNAIDWNTQLKSSF
jgi:hypothetical protein